MSALPADTASTLRRVALPVAGALAWETAARSGLVSPLIVPSLTRVGHQLWLLASQPESDRKSVV